MYRTKEVYRNSLYFVLNFSVKLTVLQKKEST